MDTHVFIWYHQEFHKLSPKVVAICQDRQNKLYLSMVSVWEMQIKVRLGKLQIRPSLEQAIHTHLEAQNVELLPIHISHIFRLQHLPTDIHHDPFDHLLIAQCTHESLTFLTNDSKIAAYSIPTLW